MVIVVRNLIKGDNMFKVKNKTTEIIYDVYDIWTDNEIYFLVYKDNEWKYVNSENYNPYEGKS
jgi:hypothetical protein